ncbi:MFS transporter [Thermogymnomonas acidicola]|uniref:MFS transporter n=1 Tax=Thermogymnomonas acidicola TaxID=399579 RepID=UPI00094644CB|nr:MFS transporter [Thermogymnomonas acidicola]
MVQYKWVALSNTTIGVLMASINGTIMLISLPAIFRGINLNPFLPSSFQYLLWILMGYMVVTAVLLVTVGRLSDIYGRVRLFNFGFLIFTIGSILLFLTPSKGDKGALELIVFRMIQAIGGSFLFANSAAIITDAFPATERGKAMGINQIAGLAGSLVGLILGGILSTINWRYVFLVSVPVGILGTVWSYLKLKDTSVRDRNQKIDYAGNAVFAGGGLTLILIGITYGLMPYKGSSMGWGGDPMVIATIAVGAALLVAFPFVETRVEQPMFNMKLFRFRPFSFGAFAGLLQSMGMGGAMFMIIILMQGIWLPLHGYSYSSVPFWAGIYTLPMMVGFVALGPVSGALSDRMGARLLTTLGMSVAAAAFLILTIFPYNFNYIPFALTLFMMGAGMGMFAAPNITAVMNSLPPHYRGGTGSGMRTTMQNTGQTSSMGIFFTIVLVTLSALLPTYFNAGLQSAGAAILIPVFDKIPPPTSALFSAFLGYNPPVGTILSLLPSSFSSYISPATYAILTGKTWFPLTLAPAFMKALHTSFYAGAGILAVAAVLSALRGRRYVYGEEERPGAEGKPVSQGKPGAVSSVLAEKEKTQQVGKR